MISSWKLTVACSRAQGQAAGQLELDEIDWKIFPVIVAQEQAPEKPDEWDLIGYFDGRPDAPDIERFAALIGEVSNNVVAEEIADQDWVSVSQSGLDPISAGRFYVHTPDHPPRDAPSIINFQVPASLAFGTGHHETTYGCLTLLDKIHGNGINVENMLDLGTGTGLLAFAAHKLWPEAQIISSDIDPVCADIVSQNITANGLTAGLQNGEVGYVTADGLKDEILINRAPYDLITANILAAPLTQMAPDICHALGHGGHLILAGLLTTQFNKLVKAYREQDMDVEHHLVQHDWSIIWLRKHFVK